MGQPSRECPKMVFLSREVFIPGRGASIKNAGKNAGKDAGKDAVRVNPSRLLPYQEAPVQPPNEAPVQLAAAQATPSRGAIWSAPRLVASLKRPKSLIHSRPPARRVLNGPTSGPGIRKIPFKLMKLRLDSS